MTTPVSYTHLKRDVGDSGRLFQRDNLKGRMVPPGRLVKCCGAAVQTDAVSYTHLDVYKRQGSDHALRRMQANTTFPSGSSFLPVTGSSENLSVGGFAELSLIHI